MELAKYNFKKVSRSHINTIDDDDNFQLTWNSIECNGYKSISIGKYRVGIK